MPDEEAPRGHPLPAGAIAITVLACAAFLALEFVPLPGLAAHFAKHGAINAGALGLTPILAAFVLVELVAVLVPALRPLRLSAEGRLRLARIAIGLAFAIPSFLSIYTGNGL